MSKDIILHNYESFLGTEIIKSFISSGSADKEIEENIENCIIMKLNGKIIGFGILKVNQIHLIMVDIKYQHKSYGSKLLAYLESILFEKNQTITLRSFKNNVNANNFYLKNNWSLIGTEKEADIEMVLFEKKKIIETL